MEQFNGAGPLQASLYALRPDKSLEHAESQSFFDRIYMISRIFVFSSLSARRRSQLWRGRDESDEPQSAFGGEGIPFPNLTFLDIICRSIHSCKGVLCVSFDLFVVV